MGWARTLLLGDIGNWESFGHRGCGDGDPLESELAMLRDELGRQKLAILIPTRFLTENGVVDGRMGLDSRTGRLRFPKN